MITGKRIIRQVTHDVTQGRHELRHGYETAKQEFVHDGFVVAPERRVETEVAYDGQPLRASHTVEGVTGFSRPGWYARVETRTLMTCSRDEFIVSNALDAFDGESKVFTKSWTFRVPRDLT